MISTHEKNKKNRKSEAGFIAAEFLFSFVLVISCGIIVFALTFSLMTVEVAQYITWSAARSYAAGNKSQGDSISAGQRKFANLAKVFPLLTGGSGEWFELKLVGIGPTSGAPAGMTIPDTSNRMGAETRHPWLGVSSGLELKLFRSLNIPFLGPITNQQDLFNFKLHAFLLRHPSQTECMEFYDKRFDEIKQLPDLKDAPTGSNYIAQEDNGC